FFPDSSNVSLVELLIIHFVFYASLWLITSRHPHQRAWRVSATTRPSAPPFLHAHSKSPPLISPPPAPRTVVAAATPPEELPALARRPAWLTTSGRRVRKSCRALRRARSGVPPKRCRRALALPRCVARRRLGLTQASSAQARATHCGRLFQSP